MVDFAAWQSFHFQKITETLKIEFFLVCRNQKPTFYIKEQLSKIKFEIRIFLEFFFSFQKWRKRFLTKKIVLKKFVKFLFLFSFYIK